MSIKKKYMRGTAGHVAKILGITYAAARRQLNMGVLKATKIALDHEEKVLTNEQEQLAALQQKETKISEMKKKLGKNAS